MSAFGVQADVPDKARHRSAAPLAYFIPHAALAGLLLVVCWHMAEKREFAHLLRDWTTAILVLATFGLTLVADLTGGIIAGCIAAAAMSCFSRGT